MSQPYYWTTKSNYTAMLDLYPQEISNYDLHMSDKNDTHVSLKKLRDHEGVTRVVSEDSIAK